MGFASSQMIGWANGQRKRSCYQMKKKRPFTSAETMPPRTGTLAMPALGGQLQTAGHPSQPHPVTATPAQGSQPSLARPCSVLKDHKTAISDTGRTEADIRKWPH